MIAFEAPSTPIWFSAALDENSILQKIVCETNPPFRNGIWNNEVKMIIFILYNAVQCIAMNELMQCSLISFRHFNIYPSAYRSDVCELLRIHRRQREMRRKKRSALNPIHSVKTWNLRWARQRDGEKKSPTKISKWIGKANIVFLHELKHFQ